MELRSDPTLRDIFEYLNSQYTPENPLPAVAIVYHANVLFTHRSLSRWVESIKDDTTLLRPALSNTEKGIVY